MQAYYIMTKWMTKGSNRYEGFELGRRDVGIAVEAPYVARTKNSVPKYRNVSFPLTPRSHKPWSAHWSVSGDRVQKNGLFPALCGTATCLIKNKTGPDKTLFF